MADGLGRILRLGIILGLLVVVELPFGRDAYERHQVLRQLDGVITERDRAAFNNWNGSARAFAENLHDRCVRDNPPSAGYCDRYRVGE